MEARINLENFCVLIDNIQELVITWFTETVILTPTNEKEDKVNNLSIFKIIFKFAGKINENFHNEVHNTLRVWYRKRYIDSPNPYDTITLSLQFNRYSFQ